MGHHKLKDLEKELNTKNNEINRYNKRYGSGHSVISSKYNQVVYLNIKWPYSKTDTILYIQSSLLPYFKAKAENI